MIKLKSLHFNAQAIRNEYKSRIIYVANEILDEYFNEVQFQMNSDDGKSNLDKLSLNEENFLRRKIMGGAYAIIDSFGTGSEMDLSNPELFNYANSESYNPLRSKNSGAITGWGKESGNKKDIFGKPIISSGRNAGKNLENIYINGEQLFEPIIPSYAFQRAFSWITHADRLPRIISRETALFVREIRKNPTKYMSYY